MNVHAIAQRKWFGQIALESLHNLNDGVVGGLRMVEQCEDEYVLSLYLSDLARASTEIGELAGRVAKRLAVLRETRTKENGHGKA